MGVQNLFFDKLAGVRRTLRLKRRLEMIAMRPAHNRLAKMKQGQKTKFELLKNNFSTIYKNLAKYDISNFTTPLWKDFNGQLEKDFLPVPPFSFLRNKTIATAMTATAGGKWLKDQLVFLEGKVPKEKLKKLLIEDYTGNPLLLNSEYLTSHTSVHHLYHIIKYSDKMKCDFKQINTIIDWGGGYGNMMKIFKRLNELESQERRTYIIIDTPLLSCLQWLYLSVSLSEKEVHLLQSPEDAVQPEKINLVPLPFMSSLKNIHADLFMSIGGLSESSKTSQDYVLANKWFNSKHLLLCYQYDCEELPNAGRIGELAADLGASIEEAHFIDKVRYAFL